MENSITNPIQEEGQLSIDVYETSKEIIIVAPVAGVRLEDINLTVTEDVLTIKGSRDNEFTISNDDYLIQECFWGEFSRSIVLPDNIDSTKINASFKDGVLKITIPRTAGGNKTKLIKIKAVQ
jgi:HSP20 family protein